MKRLLTPVGLAARLHAQNTGKSVPAADEEEAWYAPALAYAKTNALLPPDCPEDEAALTGPLSRRSLAYLLAKSTPQPLQPPPSAAAPRSPPAFMF